MPNVATLCPWESPSYLIFSSNVPTLLYYSHFVAVLAALVFVFILMSRTKESQPARWFLVSMFFFIAWTAIDVLLWASNRPDFVLFYWSLQILLEMLLYVSAFYFAYVFITKKDLPLGGKFGLAALLAPAIVLLPTHHLLSAIDTAYCNAEETSFVISYTYGVEIFLSFVLLIIAFLGMRTQAKRRLEIGLFTTGIVIFLLAFSSGNIIGSLTEDWALAQAGLFGMPVFLAFLMYIVVRFKSFDLKIIGAQALITVLWLLTLSQLFIRTIEISRIIVIVNLVFFFVLGYFLLKSVKKEIEQRERLEILTHRLEQANNQQVTLIHFITHQIKGFVTKSRNIFAMMKEGDYGVMPESAASVIDQGFESDTKGLSTIQEILNAANIKSGKVSFTMAPFDLKAMIKGIAQDLKSAAEVKGLALKLNLGTEPLTVAGDSAQLVNAYKNLIDNSIKYTQKGSVTLDLAKMEGKAVFTISDTGVGITPEDMKNLFTEGGHGKESTKVNVDSTGFGLYIVKNIIEGHKGRVWAESDGAGKGSRFIVELPI